MMKTFEELYSELQSENNVELNTAWEEAKKSSEKAKKIAFIVCLVFDIVALVIFWNNITSNLGVYAIAGLLSNLIIYFIISAVAQIGGKHAELREKYKSIVINKLINNFYSEVKYLPRSGMPEYTYGMLRYEHYDRYYSEDYFEGKMNDKYNIQLAEILTQSERESRNSQGEIETEIVTEFEGLFARIEMEKSIGSEIRIMQNGEALFSGKRLKMDYSEFEKHFDVMTANKVLGMQILTADVMEELVDFENKTKMRYDVCIKGNELYLRFHSGKMFEMGSVKKGPLEQEKLQRYFYMLNFTYNLANKLVMVINDLEV